MSRKENQNKDLAELDVISQAGNIASRVGACVCCLISVMFHRATGTILCSPWIIYFSILSTNYFVRVKRCKRGSDLFLAVLYLSMGLLALVFFLLRLMEADR